MEFLGGKIFLYYLSVWKLCFPLVTDFKKYPFSIRAIFGVQKTRSQCSISFPKNVVLRFSKSSSFCMRTKKSLIDCFNWVFRFMFIFSRAQTTELADTVTLNKVIRNVWHGLCLFRNVTWYLTCTESNVLNIMSPSAGP